MSYYKTRVLLVDDSGFVWVDCQLSAAKISKFKKAYAVNGISLTPRLPKKEETK